MNDFDIPTATNRLVLRRDGVLFQVMVSARGTLKKPFVRSRAVQTELKQIIALALHESDGELNPAPIVGRKIRVAVKRHKETDIGELFLFSKKKRQLEINPTVFSFSVSAVE